MKTRLQSLRTKLRNEGEHGRGTPILRARSRYATKYTLHVYAKRSGVLHWNLSATEHADTKEIERVAIDCGGSDEKWRDCNLGPFGAKWARCESEQPARQSGGERSIRGACRSLPPKGKFFNPLELLFNDIRPNFPKTVDRCPSQRLQGLFEGM